MRDFDDASAELQLHSCSLPHQESYRAAPSLRSLLWQRMTMTPASNPHSLLIHDRSLDKTVYFTLPDLSIPSGNSLL
jgi:hypothetical protein